jgi:hypothetical protein
VLHFNENVHREPKKSKDGCTYYHVTYPKFKLGDEVVREIPVPPTYGKSCLNGVTLMWNPLGISSKFSVSEIVLEKYLLTQHFPL